LRASALVGRKKLPCKSAPIFIPMAHTKYRWAKDLHKVFRLFFMPAVLASIDLETNVHHLAATTDANIIVIQFPIIVIQPYL